MFTPTQKLAHLTGYDQACADGSGGGDYLRREGLYSSQITQWRQLRDGGALPAAAAGGGRIPKLTAEQAENAQLKRQLEVTTRKLATTAAALEIMGKVHALLDELSPESGQRPAAVQALMEGYDQLVAAHVPHREAARLAGVSRATAARRTGGEPAQLPTRSARTSPGNKLTPAERAEVLHVLNCDRFVDQPPLQIYPTLLEEGRYLCSVSTMYRVLRENAQVKDRRRQARHPPRAVPELQATAPGQVFSWDITKLAGPVKGQYFDAYVMIDIYSRMIVGVHVHHSESAVLAVDMMKQIFHIHANPTVVHADRGTSMTSKLVSALLADLQITQSHSRPRVSNDNPYSEAWFKTLKYAPIFPDRFTSLAAARTFMSDFVDYYNHHHRHTGIGLHTPADVHYGHATTTQTRRVDTLAAARARHPTRFTTPTVIPKILALPDTAWINQPQDDAPTSAA